MKEARSCPECNVPELITREHLWLSNGDIVQRGSEGSRLAFIECENLDPLFQNMSEIIGIPIERHILNIASRENRIYMSHFLSPDVKDLLRSLKPGNPTRAEECHRLIEAANKGMVTLATIMGYGKYDIRSFRFEGDDDDYSILWVTEPYSGLLVAGTNSGYLSAISGCEFEVDWSEISEGLYEFVARRASFDEAMTDRLKLETYVPWEGDIDLDRCGTCGGPIMLGEYEWDLEKGAIRHDITGRRMAMLGSYLLDPLFKELEYELGDEVSRAVVEAERRFVRTGFYSEEGASDPEKLKTRLALRGLGSLKEMKAGKRGMRVEMANASMHLMLVGLFQGSFELDFDLESDVDWEPSRDGALIIEITPR